MIELMQWDEVAAIRAMTKDGAAPENNNQDCDKTSVRFLAGSGITDGAAKWELDVASALCGDIGSVRAVSFVATATFDPLVAGSPNPSYVVTAHTVSGGSVTLFVRTFTCRCAAAPGTPFDYHVAIAYDFV